MIECLYVVVCCQCSLSFFLNIKTIFFFKSAAVYSLANSNAKFCNAIQGIMILAQVTYYFYGCKFNIVLALFIMTE